MLGSLRVRLPLVFLAGILLAGVVTALISVRLFGQLAQDQTLQQLRREARGIALLYSGSISGGYGNANDRRAPPQLTAMSLEAATGDRLFIIGARRVFPGQRTLVTGLRQLPLSTIDWSSGKTLTFQFTPPKARRTYLAVAYPLTLGRSSVIGAIVVATPKKEIGGRVNALLVRLGLAGLLGLLVAALLSWYLARRVVRPVLQLSDAADEVAAGNYAVATPHGAPGELGHLSTRFAEMAHRLAEVETRERNFLMSVSHELRTPLTAIRGHVAALLEGVVHDPELERISLETVAAEATRLERLVDDILDLAKLDTHRFTVTSEEVDMGHLVDRAYETYRDEARRRSIEFEREVVDRPVVVSDGDRVLQVVGNLLTNAFHATPDGGRVTLELARRDGSVHVAVEDSGPGIPDEMRERLFRPFVSGGGGGTGLGLAIAKELAAALGGRLELRSEVGKGSRFELVLPANAAQPASAVGSR